MSLNKINNNLNNKSKIVCKYFIAGKCIKGKNCPYLHSPIDISNMECPMYSVGYCENGPECQFSHIKKDKFLTENNEIESDYNENTSKINEENIIDDGDATSSTPLAEDFINDTDNENENKKNNIKDVKNNSIKDECKDKKKNYPLVPIWYLEYYYDKPISMIFLELENQNLPEVMSLQKKYESENKFDEDITMEKPLLKKNNSFNNTLNLNFNNFNMNFDLSQNMTNFPSQSQIGQDTNYYNNNSYISKDQIEYIINKDRNIYYYLIKLKRYKKVKKAYESNIIKLPEILYDKYKSTNLLFNDLTIIIIIYNWEYNEFEGFAKLIHPIADELNENKRLYRIEWLWKNRMNYSEVGHLMNRADHDHFLNEGKNGCPIHNDLGNYICRLMIKRLSKKELFELINEKEIFKNQILYNEYLENLKRYQYDYNDYYFNYNNPFNYYNYFDYEYTDENNYYSEEISYNHNKKEKLKNSNKEYYSSNRNNSSKFDSDKRYRSRSRSRYGNNEMSQRKYHYYSDKNNRKHKKRRKSSYSSSKSLNKKYTKKKIHSYRNIESDI